MFASSLPCQIESKHAEAPQVHEQGHRGHRFIKIISRYSPQLSIHSEDRIRFLRSDSHLFAQYDEHAVRSSAGLGI